MARKGDLFRPCGPLPFLITKDSGERLIRTCIAASINHVWFMTLDIFLSFRMSKMKHPILLLYIQTDKKNLCKYISIQSKFFWGNIMDRFYGFKMNFEEQANLKVQVVLCWPLIFHGKKIARKQFSHDKAPIFSMVRAFRGTTDLWSQGTRKLLTR